MVKLRLFGALLVIVGGGCSAILGIDNKTDRVEDAGVADTGLDGDALNPNPDAEGATTASKVDLLLVIDDSSSMGDKANVLAGGLSTLLRRLVSAGDVHVGLLTSSLGSMGGDACDDTPPSNSRAHLRTTGPGNVAVKGAAKGFLSFGGGGSTDVDAFVADAEMLVKGLGEGGCGFEAQLESMYRFLVQPDPWNKVTVDSKGRARLEGIDSEVLAQRRAFLRPDSLLVVLMLSDEDDSSADPRSTQGQGWAFMNSTFPGSTVLRTDGLTTTAPRGTSACQLTPGSPDCTSCALAATCNTADAACQKIKNDPECQKKGGYYGPDEDALNVRFQRMKQRFGVDPQFPIARYVSGLTKERVPNREGEHTIDDGVVSDYLGAPSCANPLFAASLPQGESEELCALERGPRGRELVVFAMIGGVPETLVGGAPQWTKILGADPLAYDLSGQDPHMVQSTAPRMGLPPASTVRGDNGTDPIHGREWDTAGNDLQFACTFALPMPRTCTAINPGCDCASSKNPPLCGATAGTQLKAKAYPTIRELRVAKDLGDRGLVGSICPTAVVGYQSTMNRLADSLDKRIKK